jgi:hypothetical protein
MLKLPDTNAARTMQEFGVRLIGRLGLLLVSEKEASNQAFP